MLPTHLLNRMSLRGRGVRSRLSSVCLSRSPEMLTAARTATPRSVRQATRVPTVLTHGIIASPSSLHQAGRPRPVDSSLKKSPSTRPAGARLARINRASTSERDLVHPQAALDVDFSPQHRIGAQRSPAPEPACTPARRCFTGVLHGDRANSNDRPAGTGQGHDAVKKGVTSKQARQDDGQRQVLVPAFPELAQRYQQVPGRERIDQLLAIHRAGPAAHAPRQTSGLGAAAAHSASKYDRPR